MEPYFSPEQENEHFPSIATLERYVRGSLPDSERQALESRMEEDPFLADAVEGIRHSLSDQDLPLRLQRLRARVGSTLPVMPEPEARPTRRKSRVKPFPQYWAFTAVAASVLLFFGIVAVLKQRSDTPVATQEMSPAITSTEPSPQQPPLFSDTAPDEAPAGNAEGNAAGESPESAPLAMNTPPSTPDWSGYIDPSSVAEDGFGSFADDADDVVPSLGDSPFSEAPAVAITEDATPRPAPAKPMDTLSPEAELVQLQARAEVENSPLVRERTQSSATAPGAPAAAPVAAPRMVRAQEAIGEAEQKAAAGYSYRDEHLRDLLTQSLDLIEAGENEKALDLLDEVLLSAPDHPMAVYFKGIALMNLRRPAEALPWLEKAASFDTASFYEEARWQLARALVQTGKTRRATSLLKTIAAEPGPHQQGARELLQEID